MVFLPLTGVAYLVSPVPHISLSKMVVIAIGAIAFFLILSRLNNLDRVWRLVSILAFCAGLIALAGFFTLEWPERQVINLQSITDRLPHLSGTFYVNNNEMAGTLLMFFPLVLAAQRKQDDRLYKAIFTFYLIFLISMLIFTQSRGAILTLGVISLTWLFWGRIPIRGTIIALLIGCLVLLLIILLLGLSLSDMYTWLSAIDAGSKQGDVPANSWLIRIEIWQVAVQMVADYPVVGAGLYTFDPVSRANYVYETILPSFNLTHAHNLLLQTGASLGISGMLALVGIWTTALVGLWQASRSENEPLRRLSAVFAASITGYLFFNLYDTITFGQKPGFFAWVVLAGGIKLSQLAREQSTSAHPPFLTLGRVFSFVPLVALIVLLLSPAFPRNLANLNLDQARLQPQSQLTVREPDFTADARRAGLVHHLSGKETQALAVWEGDPQGAAFLRSQGTIALMSGSQVEAIEWYDLALVLAPDSAETYLWRGMANEERGTMGLAEADYWKAAAYSAESDAESSTKAYIHYRLGNLLAEKGEWDKAADAFAQATVYEPDEPWYYRELGDALAALGDETGAADAYQKAEQ